MKLHFLGGADKIGASCTLIEIEDQRILVDAGIRMGPGKNSKRPDFDTLGKPDVLLLTHAHSDHTGALPVLAKENRLPEKVYCTPATKDITSILLDDAVNQEKRESAESAEYTSNDVCEALSRMKLVRWMKPVQICDGVKATWIPAGHILGAAMIHIEGTQESILMTGDVSVANQLTIPGLVEPQYRPDVMVMESTYGNRTHDVDRPQEAKRLAEDVAKVIAAGGNVLIPAFAVGRSQEVILILKRAMQRKQIPEFPVYVDGMVQKVNDVYSAFGDDLSPAVRRKAERGEDIFYSSTVQPVTCEAERNSVSSGKPCCIVASSGMLNGGRSSFYAEKVAGDLKNLIAITGYQAEETPGRALQDLAQAKEHEERVLELNGGKSVSVKCKVKRYSLSAHADRDELIGLVEKVQPHKLFLVHGDKDARRKLSRSVQKTSQAVDVQLPENGREYTYTKRVGIANGKQLSNSRILSELYAYLRNIEVAGPFRLRELAEMWFGTERTTLVTEKLFQWFLSLDWQEFFVPDHQNPDLLYPRRIT